MGESDDGCWERWTDKYEVGGGGRGAEIEGDYDQARAQECPRGFRARVEGGTGEREREREKLAADTWWREIFHT